MNQDLLQAYANALYRIDGILDFRIGEHNKQLEQLHAARGAAHSHFITAFNPASRRLPAEENAARHDELGKRLDALGVAKVAAAGLDPSGQWPPEPGYLVFDLALDVVLSLGRRYGQNAVVSIGTDAVPRLVLVTKPA